MRGVMGPQAWGLLVLGVLLTCGPLIHGMQYGNGHNVRCTIGLQNSNPPQTGYACGVFQRGYSSNSVRDCREFSSDVRGFYTLYDLAFNLEGNGDSGYYTREYLIGSFNPAAADTGKYVPGTLQCYDLDECADDTSECSGNAACYNEWATYKCTCLDGYKDYSVSGSRKGYKCEKEDGKPDDGQVDIQIWVYVLIAVAILVVLMLLICCCCCYSGSGDCMQQQRTKVIKHIKVIPQQVHAPMAPMPPPPCICKPPEEKKIIIQVDQAPAPAPAPAPVVQAIEPMVSGPSAFIANSGFDGNVYIASPQAQPVQATRALPWADGSSMQTVNPPVQYIQQEPQSQQVYQYIQSPQIIQQQEQPQNIQFEQQPQYIQQVTTPYVYNVGGDPNDYYQ